MDRLHWGTTTSDLFVNNGTTYQEIQYLKEYLENRFNLIEDIVFHPEE